MNDSRNTLYVKDPTRQAPTRQAARRLRHRSVLLVALASVAPPLVLTSLWLEGCAADGGDPAKETSTAGISTVPEGSSPETDSSTGFPTPDSPSSGGDTMGFPQPDSQGGDGGSPLQDTGLPPTESGSGGDTGGGTEAAPPPPADGGCPASATLIVATSGSVTFGTAGAVCVEYMGTITNGWNAYGVEGRTVSVNGGTPIASPDSGTFPTQPPPTPEADGYIIWNWTAGSSQYAGMSLF